MMWETPESVLTLLILKLPLGRNSIQWAAQFNIRSLCEWQQLVLTVNIASSLYDATLIFGSIFCILFPVVFYEKRRTVVTI
ncbi:hypothetical protein NPIL_703671 [Nephila pilipes]|uniref:Uncharacterized protein n=1 Tax=Nephila pilipes TaxID=299642 RepID=A0A8X6MV81_NEPPI|nr:hypothetical protein NPIL_703671 [Nephila pilipes]